MADPTEHMEAALREARRFEGRTDPNPPVGAAAVAADGRVLGVAAHERAGTAHAEVALIERCRKDGTLAEVDSLYVTLEPCNHTGRTPPCTDAIIASGIKKVFIGCGDPNPKVAGGGASALRSHGISVELLQGDTRAACEKLIQPFAHWSRTGLPFVVVKTALDPSGSMIPPAGAKTFTSQESLRFAHELRKRSGAILTGSGTVLADRPEFTVRHVPDHPAVRRWLVIMDRRGRVPNNYILEAESRGFQVRVEQDLESAVKFLGRKGVLQVLVEAGPTLSKAVLQTSFWCRHVLITQGNPDRIQVHENEKVISVQRHC